MLIDSGFNVDNYVGTYRIVRDPVLNQAIILSEEFTSPEQGESELQVKRVVNYDGKEMKTYLTDFMNINLNQHSSILAFCNRYGLPYSSQRIADMMGVLGDDVDDSVKEFYARNINPQTHPRQDYMTMRGFCNSVLIARQLARLNALRAEQELTDSQYTEWISILVFFLFFSHRDDYCYDWKQEQLPKARLMRFQYYYQLSLRGFEGKITEFQSVVLFLCSYTASRDSLAAMADKGPAHVLFMTDRHSAEIRRMLLFFTNFFLDHLEKAVFYCDGFCEVHFEQELHYDGSPETLETLRQISSDVIMAVINVGLEFVAPMLETANGTLRGGWRMNFLMNAIYMKLFLEIAQNNLYRQCANPKCQRLFSAAENRSNKIYCCHECGELVAQWRQRARKKAAKQQQNGPRGELP